MNYIFINKVLTVFQKNIIPLTEKGVLLGNKIFGAAILKKNDYSLIVAGSNAETLNPLWHGEIYTIKKFYEISSEIRIKTKDCIFISSHEPCSLCLSAITWCGFDNFYYLFPYKDTSDIFNIPHDVNILKEVFNINNGNYKKNNIYWKSYNINNLITELSNTEQKKIIPVLKTVMDKYKDLSEKYQFDKNQSLIPLK